VEILPWNSQSCRFAVTRIGSKRTVELYSLVGRTPILKLSEDEWPVLHDPPFDDAACSELLKNPSSQTHVLTTVASTVAPVNLDQVINLIVGILAA